jgi:hypothetical protein
MVTQNQALFWELRISPKTRTRMSPCILVEKDGPGPKYKAVSGSRDSPSQWWESCRDFQVLIAETEGGPHKLRAK